ncbi:MAG: phosphoribosylaminoimidazole-succinocarboxamide synthase [Planctomycetota bacterium]|jgi:phosphoribosylaminoimidazole-succinocarboxamide synthase
MACASPFLGRDQRVPGLELLASGKVRDVYALDARHLLFVTTDRVSAFDVVMREGVPFKGQVLTAISAFWFARTRDIIDNHLVSTSVDDLHGLDAGWRERLQGRVMIVRRAQPTSVEWVVRGYLAGSGWKEYRERQSICGVPLPAGLVQSSRLPTPILTPTTKEAAHDLPLTPEQACERVGKPVFDAAHKASLELFARGTRELDALGILLADTKFEFGVLDNRVILIDEALTPDSSRFWDKRDWKLGGSPPSYDKQILRDWLEAQPWNKEYPPPTLDPAIVRRVSERYLEICAKITGSVPAGVEVP